MAAHSPRVIAVSCCIPDQKSTAQHTTAYRLKYIEEKRRMKLILLLFAAVCFASSLAQRRGKLCFHVMWILSCFTSSIFYWLYEVGILKSNHNHLLMFFVFIIGLNNWKKNINLSDVFYIALTWIISWIFLHTECGQGMGTYFVNGEYICQPCPVGTFASNFSLWEDCDLCPFGYTNGVTGAIDDSGCTSMYSSYRNEIQQIHWIEGILTKP